MSAVYKRMNLTLTLKSGQNLCTCNVQTLSFLMLTILLYLVDMATTFGMKVHSYICTYVAT